MELNVYNVNACLDLTLFVDKHTYIGEDWDPINGFNPPHFYACPLYTCIGEDWDPINGFNPTSFLCLYIIYLHRGGLGSHKRV